MFGRVGCGDERVDEGWTKGWTEEHFLARGCLNVGRRQSGVGLDIEGPGRTWRHRRAWATMSYISAC